MKNSIPFLFFCLIAGSISTQSQEITLSFTAVNDDVYVQLDSILIQNKTQAGEIVLVYPDTVFTIAGTGMDQPTRNQGQFSVLQNVPNPYTGKTTFTVHMPAKGGLQLRVVNLPGQEVMSDEFQLMKGDHRFTISGGKEVCYVVSAFSQYGSASIKINHLESKTAKTMSLHYDGPSQSAKSGAVIESVNMEFNPGDLLLFVGYAALSESVLESGFSDDPEQSTDYTFQYATNIPCPGMPMVTYDGQEYNTIQVFSQCWFKENLNAGTMLNSGTFPTNNATIEKYCLGDDPYYCSIVGGLYFWGELMDYTYESGTQGICPEGWHIPTDLDWDILEGAVDSQFGIGDPEWETDDDWRGSDAGGNLKETGTGTWYPPNTGATDAFGFTALPGGYYVQGDFWGYPYKGYFYSSNTQYKYYRNVDWNQSMIQKGAGSGNPAFSVRCLKD
jgi:uncharacterized protein (TIGR02145 family)